MAGLLDVKIVTFSLLVLTLFSCVVSQGPGGGLPGGEMLTGGESEFPVDSPEVTNLANLVATKLSEGDNKDRKVVEVLKATRQVVAGTLTHLKLKISDGDLERVYEASIWERPWLNHTEITKLEPVDNA